MTIKAAVVQFSPGKNKGENLDAIEHHLRAASAEGVRLAVLPEFAIYTAPVMGQEFVDAAESVDGPSIRRLQELSTELKIAIVAGMNETADGKRIHNTLVGIDGGETVAVYRKVHLYDAFGYKESSHVIPAEPGNGDTFEVDGFTVGMQTCYDLRFPEVSRLLIDAGATVLALPAEWVPGPQKEYHWNTLIRARAIENTAYVVAADQSGPAGVGQSAIIDPMGVALAQIGETQGIVTAEISKERLESALQTNPALVARRYRVDKGES